MYVMVMKTIKNKINWVGYTKWFLLIAQSSSNTSHQSNFNLHLIIIFEILLLLKYKLDVGNFIQFLENLLHKYRFYDYRIQLLHITEDWLELL